MKCNVKAKKCNKTFVQKWAQRHVYVWVGVSGKTAVTKLVSNCNISGNK